MGEAAARWRRLVRAQRAERERLGAAEPAGGMDWNRRARWYVARTSDGRGDPFFPRLRRAVGPATTVIDVGAGTGRLAIPISAHARRVIAVDPSTGMLRHLRRAAREAGVTNITVVTGRWQDVEVEVGDVAFCSFAMPGVEDADVYLGKMDAHARRRAFLYMSAYSSDWYGIEPFWRHFHGRARPPAPTYLDAVAILEEEVGVHPHVEIIDMPGRMSFASPSEAVDDYRRALMLPDRVAVRRELERMLEPWLVRRGGRLFPPVRSTLSAILSWSPRGGA